MKENKNNKNYNIFSSVWMIYQATIISDTADLWGKSHPRPPKQA